MPDLSKSKAYESPWLKANLNCKQGDLIQFLDAGEEDEENGSWIFNVMVSRDGEDLHQKKFSLNKTNFKVVAKNYGTNSDSWVGKQMEVNVIKKQNPKSGELVDSVALSLPNHNLDGDVVIE